MDSARNESRPQQMAVAGFVVDLHRRALIDPRGQVVPLRAQAYEVLAVLARNVGRLVTKDELFAAVWPGLVVTEDSLVQAIGDVRRAFGPSGHRVIKTVARRGYMLLADGPAAKRPEEDGSITSVGGERWRVPIAAVVASLLIGLAAAVAWQRGTLTDRDGPPNPPSSASATSIAVLPFKGAQGNPEDAVIALDIAAELVSELARSPDIRVVSSQSSFRFSVEKEPLVQIGRRLRSRYLVDGTVRRTGEALRIGVELLDSQGGHVVWSMTTVADRSTLSTTQRQIVGKIAGTLQSRVVRSEERRLTSVVPKTLDVFVLTAHGKSMMQRYSAHGMREARRHLQEALAADPDYAPAWAYLAMTDTIDIGLRLSGERDRRHGDETLASAQRALTLQPDLTVAHVALSQALGVLGQFDASLAAAQQCLRLSPNDASCFYVLGTAELRLGNAEAAVNLLEQAADRNPFAPAYLPAFHATALWASRRLDEAIRASDNCLSLAPDFWRCRMDRIAALVESGRIDDARREAERLRARSPQLQAESFGAGFADQAVALRERRVAAAKAAGL